MRDVSVNSTEYAMMVFKISRVRRVIRGFLSVIILFCGCMPDAERDNPFDPHLQVSEDVGQLKGRVTRLYFPFEGIEGVSITLSESGGSDRTDTDGEYLISDIPPGHYMVTANKHGYASDSSAIEIASGQILTDDFVLDGLPYILNSSITSEHSWSSPTKEQFYSYFEVQIDDPDGLSDIDSVYVDVQTLNFSQRLTRVLNTNWYRATVTEDAFAGDPLEVLVGQEALFYIRDKIGNRINSSPQFLIRIIYPSPATILPNEEEKMDERQLLVWEPFTHVVNFDFTFTVDVESFSQGWQRENIPPDSTSIVITELLDSQYPYRWSVWIVDEFGNTSKSPYVTFSVEGGK
jgi:hypothetical protein